MNLIIGGAYQGKLDYARNKYGYEAGQIFTCSGCEIDFSQPCIDHVEEFVLCCVRQQKDPVAYFKKHWEDWRHSTLICMDLSCGVVPLEAEMRAWRNENGRLCQYLSGQAFSVVRIFCGLEQKLK